MLQMTDNLAVRGQRGSNSNIRIKNVRKAYGTHHVLDDLSFDVSAGEFLTILGASGSGKTTLLKLIAGFEEVDGGTIFIGDHDVTRLPPAQRNIGMVFQHYALFPHMSVEQNVAFPLEARRLKKPEIRKRVYEALGLVEMSQFATRLPSSLSGGQQQRVALARAIVYEPDILLLDEPFGALDRKLRETMQLQVRKLQHQLGLTTIFITHDQEEALIMSDRIAVFGKGYIEQLGRPREIYDSPVNSAVADFIGESNLLSGTVVREKAKYCICIEDKVLLPLPASEQHSYRGGQEIKVLLRPERLELQKGSKPGAVIGQVLDAVYLGPATKYRVSLSQGGPEFLIRASATTEIFSIGQEVFVSIPDDALRIIGEGTSP